MSLRHALILCCLLSGPVYAAESYDNCTDFIDSLPATISTQGVWCLRDHLGTAITSGNAITIATNNVTIDCNHFKIGGLAAGDGSLAIGIRADARRNATVRQCNIRGFFAGIDLQGGSGHLVEDNRLDNNLYVGIRVSGTGNRIQGNRIHDTGGATRNIHNSVSWGIHASADIIDNTISGVYSTATDTYPRGIFINAGYGFEVRGNRIRGLVVDGSGHGYGIVGVGTDSAIVDNRVSSSIPGYGIIDNGALDTVCIGNTVAGFATAFSNCIDGGRNDSL